MKKRCVKIILFGLGFVSMSLIVLAGMPLESMASDTVKIGILEPLTGPFEFASRVYGSAAKFAAGEQNEKGGLLGKKIEIIIEDNELKPDVAVRKAKKLILKEKVNFLSVGTGSHIHLALSKVATAYKTLLFGVGAASDVLQGKEFSRYTFRLCNNSTTWCIALTKLMATTPHKRFYIIGQDYVGGHDFANTFKKHIKISIPDAKIVGEDYHPFATKDFGPYITKIIAAKPDAVVTSNWGTDLINLVNQARSLGLKQPFPFVMIYGNDPSHLYGMKENAVGSYYAHMFSARLDTPEIKEMVRKFHDQHKNDKDFLTWWPVGNIGQAICGWKMIFAAIEKAGSLDPEKIIETLEGFWYKTPVGWWSMRKCDHQVILPMFGGRVEAGWNPYFNGSIRPDVKFPWPGPKVIKISAMDAATPPTSDYNPRCP